MSPLDLLPLGQQSHTVAQSGNWSDPNTWSTDEVPGPLSSILIPNGTTLTVDGAIPTRIKIIRNHGRLRFSPSINTSLAVETIVQGMDGALEIGTSSAPIPAGITSRITIIDEGDIDLLSDQWEKGLILMGSTVAYGAPKTAWTEVAENPLAGTTTLNLATAPIGWAVGDRVVITGTDPVDVKSDEVGVIESINGSIVELAQPLTKHRPTPAEDLVVHVANLSRNIVIESENTANPLDRGHIMFMHTLDVDFNNVRIHQLGRTRKDVPIDDWFLGEGDEFMSGNRTNIRGRYSIHFHRGGASIDLDPAYVRGTVVEDDPGWAYTNHSAYVHFDNNVSYNIIGGGFQTESGDELGSFTNNIAIRTVNDEYPLRWEVPDNAPDTREVSQDFAFQGDGFWVHGGGVSLSGNVAAGSSGHGFIYWPEGLIEPGFPSGTYRTTVLDSNFGLSNVLVDPDFMNIAIGWIPIAGFFNNQAYGATVGLSSYYLHTTFFNDKDEYNPDYLETVHSTFDGFTAWNVFDQGIQLNFTERVTYNNIRLVNDDGNASSIGINASQYRIMDRSLFSNVSIKGFGTGFALPPQGRVSVLCGELQNATNFYIPSAGLKPRDLRIAQISSAADPAFPDTAEIRMQPFFSPPDDKFPAFFLLPDKIILDYGPYFNQRLYFNEQASDYVALPFDAAPYTFFEDERRILAEFAVKSNQQLQSDYSMSFGGSITPVDADSPADIVGGKIHPWQNETLNVPVCVDFARENRWPEINACILAAGPNKVAGPLAPFDHPSACLPTNAIVFIDGFE